MLNLFGMFLLPVILLGGIALLAIVAIWVVLGIRKRGWPSKGSVVLFVVALLFFLLAWLPSLWLCFYLFNFG